MTINRTHSYHPAERRIQFFADCVSLAVGALVATTSYVRSDNGRTCWEKGRTRVEFRDLSSQERDARSTGSTNLRIFNSTSVGSLDQS